MEIDVDFFCDSDERKNNQEHENIKVISIADLNKLDKNTNIFIAHDYFLAVMPNLDENDFKNIYTTTELLTYPNLLDMYEGDLYPLKLKRRAPCVDPTTQARPRVCEHLPKFMVLVEKKKTRSHIFEKRSKY